MSTKEQVDSYYKTLSELGSRQFDVLYRIKTHPEGISAWQISKLTGVFVHAVRPRIVELKNMGLIRQSGQRWNQETNRHEAVWSIEQSGQQELPV
jgi:hypothetical protein